MIKCWKNIGNSCIVITFVEIRNEKKCYQAHVMNLLHISYFGKCEYNYCFNMQQEHDNNIFKECSRFFISSNNFTLYWKKTSQEILYKAMLDYLLRYIGSRSGRKLVLGATVVCSHDLSLRTNYYSIVSFCLYAWEIHHSRHGIGKVWETWDYKFASIRHFNFDIAMLHIDETSVKVGM